MNVRFFHATFLCAVVLGGAACIEEEGPDFGTTALELTKADVKAKGVWWCTPSEEYAGEQVCTVCYVDHGCLGTGIRCERYHCYGDADTDGCTWNVPGDNNYCWQGPSYHYAVQFGFEAESVTRYAPMVVGGLASASNGGYITVPTTAAGASNLRYSFDLESDVELYGWARVQVPAPVGPDDTWINLDGENTISVHLPYIGPNQWQWVPLADAYTGEHVPFVAAAGPHRFRLFSNPTGVRIDRVILTNDRYYVPVTDVHEAESMSVYGPMVKVVPPAATLSNPGYIWVPNGAPAGGEASKVIYNQKPGRFSFWGRVNAPTAADNSFYVSNEYEETTTWSMPTTATNGWKWHQVLEFASTDPKLFELTEIFSSVEVLRREDGTKLDRFLITNDPGFLPVDVPLVVGQP